jgi:hypothetical protein
LLADTLMLPPLVDDGVIEMLAVEDDPLQPVGNVQL